MRPSVQATKASIENINLINSGRGEVAFTLGDSCATLMKATKLRALKEAHQSQHPCSYLSELCPDRRLQGIRHQDVGRSQGKRLSVGAPKSGTELNARTILEAAGLSYDDLGKIEYLPFAESVELMKNRQLDATLQSSGLGVASLRDLANSVDINVVEVPADVIEKIGAPYQVNTIPANTYSGGQGRRDGFRDQLSDRSSRYG